MENQSPHLSLRVPTPTQQNLSFCDATPKDIKYWLAHLPKANLGETARQLYQGLIELNQLVLPVEARLQLLELFRPEVHFVCATWNGTSSTRPSSSTNGRARSPTSARPCRTTWPSATS